MEHKRKAEFLDYLIQEVNKIPVEKIVGSVVDLVQHDGWSPHLDGLCPFHPDSHTGNFKVTPSKNLWYCFACNIGGSGITFEMEYYNIGFLEAVFRLALDYAIISKEEYDAHSRMKYDPSVVKRLQRQVEEPKKITWNKAPENVIHNVYSAIPGICTLSKAHKQHLLKERGLSQNDLGDYFTFPTRKTDLPKKVYQHLASMLAEQKYQKKLFECSKEELQTLDKALTPIRKDLRTVPGFFYDKKNDRIDFSSYRGIGFLVRDDRGKALGIQIRRDSVKKGESRYVWFSSSFASSQSNMEGGSSPGAPGGVIFPKTQGDTLPSICVTEGRFKAEKIADAGNIAIYVSGVSSWKSVLPLVDRIQQTYPCKSSTIFLMFDADMMGNVAVHRQLKAFAETLQAMGRTVKLILWPKKKGKGFDDLVLANKKTYTKYLQMVEFNAFERMYTKILQDLLKGKSIRDIPTGEAEAFTDSLQDKVEKTLLSA